MSRYLSLKEQKEILKRDDNCIFIQDTKKSYGYRLNISHPKINELWHRYKASKGIPYGMPASDSERLDFEKIIIDAMKKKNEVKNGGNQK